MNYYMFYVVFHLISVDEVISLWKSLFSICDSFSVRFPLNNNEKIHYNFVDDFNKNIIKKYKTNNYLGDKFTESQIVCYCKFFNKMGDFILRNPFVNRWGYSDGLPEDLCLFKGGNMLFYNSVYEDYSIVYATKPILDKLCNDNEWIKNECIINRIKQNSIPKL